MAEIFRYSPSRYVPYRDQAQIQRCRRIKRDEIERTRIRTSGFAFAGLTKSSSFGSPICFAAFNCRTKRTAAL